MSVSEKDKEQVNYIEAYEDGCLDVLHDAILDGKNEIPELYQQYLMEVDSSVRFELENLLKEAIEVSKKIQAAISAYRSVAKRWSCGDKDPFQ